MGGGEGGGGGGVSGGGGSVEPSLAKNFIFIGNLDKFNTFGNQYLP